MLLTQIATGWYNFITGSADTKELMTDRLAICHRCPSKQQLSRLGKLIVSSIHADGSVYYCKECKCPLAGKSAQPKAKCPLGKW